MVYRMRFLLMGFLILILSGCKPPLYEPLAFFAEDDDPWYLQMDNQGDEVYIIGSFHGLSIINVSDPQNPFLVGNYHPQVGKLRNVLALGDYVLVINNEIGIEVIDVRDPTSPQQVGIYSIKFDYLIYEFIKAGDLVYISEIDSDVLPGFFGPNINTKILDISDPLNISFVNEIVDSGYPLKINNNTLFTLKSTSTDEALVDELNIYDISDLNDIKLLYQGIKFGYIADLDVQDTLLYLGDTFHGFRIIDISDISNPIETHSLEFYPVSFLLDDPYVYIGFLFDVKVVDLSDPSSPKELARSEKMFQLRDIIKANEYIFVLDDLGLYIFEEWSE